MLYDALVKNYLEEAESDLVHTHKKIEEESNEINEELHVLSDEETIDG
tara:strand:- start:135 stop:278 length:144 start_codon:yes stop_codon:yes gene_type:complete